jgi:hypothetical protein
MTDFYPTDRPRWQTDQRYVDPLPAKVRAVVDRWGLVEQDQPNPEPRPGNRPIHTSAIRLWTGGRSTRDGNYADDGYDWKAMAAESGWPANSRYGDWPIVVECLKAFPSAVAGEGPTRFFRFTYLEGSVYLAEYRTSNQLLDYAWKADL